MTRSSSSVSLHPPRSVSSDISHLRSASSSTGAGVSSSGAPLSGGGGGGGLMSVGMLRSSTAPIPQHHNLHTTSSTSTTTTTTATTGMSNSSGLTPPQLLTTSPSVQTRILHPQVHYIFENDPLETEILESIPKSQCITMDFDPRSGVIKNVESYLTQLQVIDVRLVQSFGQDGQGALGGSSSSLSPPSASASGTGTGTGVGGTRAGAGAVSSSSSASSLKATTTAITGAGGGGTTDESQTHSVTAPPQPSTSSLSSSSLGAPGGTLLARNNSLISSTLQSSFRTSRRSTDKGARGDVSVGDDKSSSFSAATTATMASKDWTLVIDAVELDRRDQER
ncbi:hypothetical protein BGZ47_004809 [Haplosporangium gracile]|nr:hypothetical protein BGZ47_004809 [Haplosporangium gracile]